MKNFLRPDGSKRPGVERLPLHKYAPWAATLCLGLAVFLFWRLRYPFALVYQEQLQMFLFDDDYLLSRLSEPGGLARYVAEFLVQFYNGVAIGAAILAVLFMLVQRLTWRLMRSESHYAWSFVPALLLWYAMGDESLLLTYVVALVLTLLATWLLARWFWAWGYTPRVLGKKMLVMLVLVPLMYWLVGPMVLLLAAFLMPISVVYALGLMLLSAYWLPYPMSRVMIGISYYRIPDVLTLMTVLIPVVVFLIGNIIHLLPRAGRKVTAAEAISVVLAAVLLVPLGYEAKKYELMEYDYLVRVKDWQAIIAKAERQTPDLPMSVSATNLALAMTNQLGDRAFDFYQRGAEGLLPGFERNFATTQLTGEIYFHLGLVNTAQRLAFEAMEAIPNYNKSARVVKRLAETNLINGQYDVARKYLAMLQKTIFYRPWAERTLAMLPSRHSARQGGSADGEAAIDRHPLYGTLRRYRLQDDFLFSEQEIDKICGQLLAHCQQNRMAAQYLVMAPLMDRDIARFMQYAQYVQTTTGYNPRHCQEAEAFAFMQQRQQPPQGLISQYILQQMNDFARIYAAGRQSPELQRFRNTAWYYLVNSE